MELNNTREPIAYKSMFKYYFMIIPNGILFILTIIIFILGQFDEGLKISIFILIASLIGWAPFLILFFIKYKKPKVLICKGHDDFIIHCITKDISIPMETIRKTSCWYPNIGIIYIKTDSKFLWYKVLDIKNADQVCSTMNSLLDDFKNKMKLN